MEAYWLINFCLDLMLLALGHRPVQRIRWRRVAGAAALGACAACLSRQVSGIPGGILLAAGLMVMCLLASGGRRVLAYTARTAFCALCTGGAAAVLKEALGGWTLPALLLTPPASLLILVFFLDGRARQAERRQVLLSLSARGQRIRLEALVDTGNCLREPISQLPVLVTEEALVSPLLPPDYGHTPLPRGFRLVRYGGVGGSGQMLCFLPDEIRALKKGKWKPAPDMWVALYPGRLPGGARALAPGQLGMQ